MTTSKRLEILTYDGLRMKVGETSDAGELEADHSSEGGRRGEIYSRLKALSRPLWPISFASGIPIFLAGFQDTTSIICFPRMAFMSRARWSARKAPASPCSKPPAGWWKVLRRECCW